VREVADAPRHHADFRLRQFAQRRLVEMIEVRVRQQHQVNRRQIPDFHAGALDALQQKQPVREIRVNQHVQIRELDQKRRVADPRDGHLPALELRKNRAALLAVRGVSHAFQISSWKNVRGLKCFDGVKSLNERGKRRRGGTGRCGTGFVM
jgi:hypothetical protein